MARCKAVGGPTAAVFFYLATNLRKEFKAVNYIHGIDSLVFVTSDKGFGLRHVQHAEPHLLFLLYVDAEVLLNN